jgi:hypothetical protein
MVPALLLATLLSPPEAWVMVAGVGVFTLVSAAVFRKKLDSFWTFWVFFGLALFTMIMSLILRAPTLFLVMLTTVVTTLTMFYMGSAGVWSSTRFSSSWRSLLATMGIGYVGGFVLWLLTTPVTLVVSMILFTIFMLLSEFDRRAGTQTAGVFKTFTGGTVIAIMASAIVLGATFFGVPWLFIVNAEKRVSETERIRVWRDGELRGPGRRRRRVRKLKTG